MADPLATYTFLPWLRQGISSRIGTVDALGGPAAAERAQVEVGFDVNAQPIANVVQLVGPGDVVGINPRAVIRTEPRHGTSDFEGNYLPFIEFLDPDFAWRHTPAKATPEHRLRPWISLVVLVAGEFTRGRVGPLPSVTLLNPDTALPRFDQTWAWAHVHVSRDVTDAGAHTAPQTVDELEDVVARNPDEAVCRVLCPRKLRPLTAYHAFLIPTFETGRLAGLGEDTGGVDGLRPAWGDGQTDERFPVYYEWSFGTGERGDFEFLVNLLEPREVDARVGIRAVDASDPDPLVEGLPDPVGLEGALRKPRAVSDPAVWPPEPPPGFVTDLEDVVNRQEDLLEDPAVAGPHPDPIVSPPLYGRWHAKVRRLEASRPGWPNELNGDPRLRMPAAFGTDVVKKNQEGLMRRAWQQLGDVLEANQRIRRVQLAILASRRLFKRHLESLDAEEVLATTQAVHAHVQASPETVHELVRSSRLPQAATSAAFRKVTRPRGVIQRKAVPAAGGRPAAILARLNDDKDGITAAPPKRAPEGQIALNTVVERLVPVPRRLLALGRWVVLGLVALTVALAVAVSPVAAIPAAVAAAGLAAATEALRRRVALADALGERGLTAAAVAEVPARPSFAITEPGTSAAAAVATGGDNQEAALFRTAAADLHGRFEVRPPAPVRGSPLAMARAAEAITTALDPARAISRRARSVVNVPDSHRTLRPPATIEPVMAHPVFADPMYAPLRDISADLLLPNLHLIPDDTIALAETNRRFIEAYMVGLNHEMARELLWREYLTDQRGSYFRQFWDVSDVVNRDESRTPAEVEEELRDVAPLHRWRSDTALGTHESRSLPTGAGAQARLVLVIKGRVLQRYPTTMIFAQKAVWETDELGNEVRRLDETDPSSHLREPVFKAEIEPDLTFLGFDLTASEAKGRATRPPNEPGWFFVFQQRPGEPRFGMDILEPGEPLPAIETWNDLSWNHLGVGPLEHVDLSVAPPDPADPADRQIVWGSNAADLAYILYQAPVMVAFHAADMLP